MMPPLSSFAFLFLSLSFLSLWIRREPKIWGSLLAVALIAGLAGGNILPVGMVAIFGWTALWIAYVDGRNKKFQIPFILLLVLVAFAFKFNLIPGFQKISFTEKFSFRMEKPLIGLFPLALVVPLAMSKKDWWIVLRKGVPLSCAGVALLAILAVGSGATLWHFKIPSHAGWRYLSNLILVAIPEEAFFRGFLQRELCRTFSNSSLGKGFALVITSAIFTALHIGWSPNLAILGFVFLASLIYGGVYLITEKIESAIFCHFLLNFIHMTFFSYHAM